MATNLKIPEPSGGIRQIYDINLTMDPPTYQGSKFVIPSEIQHAIVSIDTNKLFDRLNNINSSTKYASLFNGCMGITNLDLSNWIIEDANLDMNRMFSNTSNLKKIVLPLWNIGNATSMFYYSGPIESLELPDGFNIVNGNSTFMYSGIKRISGKNIKINTMTYTFRFCSNLKEVDLENFTFKLCSYTFGDCQNLERLDMSTWIQDATINVGNMLNNCYNLKEVKLFPWVSTSNCTVSGFFSGCKSLEIVDLSPWNIMVRMGQNLFQNCESLKKIWAPSTFKSNATNNTNAPFYTYTGNPEGTHIYTDASDASSQGWRTINSNYIVHYNSTYEEFIAA